MAMDASLGPHPEGEASNGSGNGSGNGTDERARRPGTPLSLAPVDVTVDDEQDGSYVGRFTATVAGSYELQVRRRRHNESNELRKENTNKTNKTEINKANGTNGNNGNPTDTKSHVIPTNSDTK